jgi:quercetin dioxygenase-like cupin family protein
MNIFEKTDFTGDKPSVVSIKKSEKVNLFTVGLSEKQVLAKHITTIPATLVLLRGKVDFNISGETTVLREGDIYEIPVNVEHEVVGRDIENDVMQYKSDIDNAYLRYEKMGELERNSFEGRRLKDFISGRDFSQISRL